MARFKIKNARKPGQSSQVNKNLTQKTLEQSSDQSPLNTNTENINSKQLNNQVNVGGDSSAKTESAKINTEVKVDDGTVKAVSETASDVAENIAKSSLFSFDGIPKQAKVAGLVAAGVLLGKIFDDD